MVNYPKLVQSTSFRVWRFRYQIAGKSPLGHLLVHADLMVRCNWTSRWSVIPIARSTRKPPGPNLLAAMLSAPVPAENLLQLCFLILD